MVLQVASQGFFMRRHRVLHATLLSFYKWVSGGTCNATGVTCIAGFYMQYCRCYMWCHMVEHVSQGFFMQHCRFLHATWLSFYKWCCRWYMQCFRFCMHHKVLHAISHGFTCNITGVTCIVAGFYMQFSVPRFPAAIITHVFCNSIFLSQVFCSNIVAQF